MNLKIKKRVDIEREHQEREARQQKESQRRQEREAEVEKLKRADLTLEQKVEVLWKLAGLDKGVERDAGGKGEQKVRP